MSEANNTKAEEQPAAESTPASAPRKRKIIPYKNIRAHANPLADGAIPCPLSPAHMDWTELFPRVDFSTRTVDFADIGCGYGGLTVALGEAFPDKLTVGMELRSKVGEYVEDRIEEMRSESDTGSATDKGQNIALARVNAMKHLPNYFRKGELEKIFFLFPDPHFKKANHRRRIINPTLLSEYAFVLNPNVGIAYTITDVKDLHEWMVQHFDSHPLFERMTDDELVMGIVLLSFLFSEGVLLLFLLTLLYFFL
jgi:tRNA (guanine-N7-)-methyltransferase